MKGLILPGVLALAALVVLVSLGNWQMSRLAWKEELIGKAAERPLLPPIHLRHEDMVELGDPTSFLELNEYRALLVTGEYAPRGEVLVFTSLSDAKGLFSGPGYWVLTPFVTVAEGALVYVNRGFVPEGRKRAYAPPAPGQVTVQGLIRAPERGSWFTPDANLQERVFYARHPERIAEATAVEGEVAGFFLDLLAAATPPGGLPQAGETRMTFSNNHLAYAFTWYGLAAALLAVFASFVSARLREGSQGPRLTRPGGTP